MENQWVMTVSPKNFLKKLCHMSQESTKKQLGPCGNTGKPVVIVKVNKVSFIQVEPGKPGAEVSKQKDYKPKKEFAYRMCTG